jgi:hypothetical protein
LSNSALGEHGQLIQKSISSSSRLKQREHLVPKQLFQLSMPI